MTGKSETVPGFPASLVVAMLSAVKRQMISIAGWDEEMEYIRKMGVFEVVDEKECYDNGCKTLELKFVDKMRTETNNLDQKTYFHPCRQKG